MNEPVTIITGRLGADPELRYTPSGQAVANLNIASTPRRRNKQTSQWEDGETLWMRATAWGRLAEATTEALRKGDPILAVGRLQQRAYTTRDGEQRTSIELTIDEIGRDVRFTKPGQPTTAQAPGAPAQQQAPSNWAADPWGAGTGEPPF